MEKSRDQDQGKGAVEQDQLNQGGNTSMNGQLGHRDEDVELKDGDSDLSGWQSLLSFVHRATLSSVTNRIVWHVN